MQTASCDKQPSSGVAGTKTAEYCAQHALEGMVDVHSRKCRTGGCGKKAYFGVAGTKTGECCAQHLQDGMVDVKSRKCRTATCGKQPFFGVAGTKSAKYCAQHAPEGMVDVKSRKCRTEGCGKRPFFGVADTKTGEYCSQHAQGGMVNVKSRLQRGVEGFREREVGPHHSGKESIANVILSFAKHTSVCPPPKTSQLLSASRDSRKRVRHPEITSTASKRAVAREPTAGVVTMPDIDGQKSPVKRICSVKVEMQLSL